MSNIKSIRQPVLDTSPLAAQYKTVTGWVSREGRFFGEDEYAARWNGADLITCKKNPHHEPFQKHSWCTACRAEAIEKMYAEMSRQKWDGTTPISIFGDDEYFYSLDELLDFCYCNEVQPQDLKLVLCQPVYPKKLDFDDTYEVIMDNRPEDVDIQNYYNPVIDDLIDRINYQIEKLSEISWKQSNIAVYIDESLNFDD
ncbi:hypothetical protein OO184_10785 [Photorhabdus sp. APURE]|uniref:hypothetical protein n=1 Tax=Photorhabdus aballayi TaxID=2991723 RepID=UPI00223D97A8|nr:hypothetical protein [Photorhabdus aballayi]MCW7548413.1 hypothetical protein [Photorhabdus aballayi]